MTEWTIQKLLNWIAEYFTENAIDSPRLSAEILLSHVLELKRIELYTQFDKPVPRPKLDQLHALVKRAAQKEPVPYLTGTTEFYSLQLEVNNHCLIPRPETELLVERAVEFLRPRNPDQLVCDLCTGSACIAIAIAANCSTARIIATDICDSALKIAEQNIEKHRLKDRIKLLQGDLFEPIIPQLDTEKFDLVVTNPPYVSSAEFDQLDKNIKDYEPASALLAGDDGLDICRRIIASAEKFLKPDGALFMEIGCNQGTAVKELLENTKSFDHITIEKDYHENDRVVLAKK
ncbi:peptide chain release factor N(5)-glutamine methyltransferase [Planctomycetota bacterium]